MAERFPTFSDNALKALYKLPPSISLMPISKLQGTVRPSVNEPRLSIKKKSYPRLVTSSGANSRNNNLGRELVSSSNDTPSEQTLPLRLSTPDLALRKNAPTSGSYSASFANLLSDSPPLPFTTPARYLTDGTSRENLAVSAYTAEGDAEVQQVPDKRGTDNFSRNFFPSDLHQEKKEAGEYIPQTHSLGFSEYLRQSENPQQIHEVGLSFLPSFRTSFTPSSPPAEMDSSFYQRDPEIFHSNYCPSGVMTSTGGSFLPDMPSASSAGSSSSPPSPPETVVVINGLTPSMGAGGPKSSQRISVSASGGSAAPLVTIGASSAPLVTIVPRVVNASPAEGSSSSVGSKSAIVAASDSPQIIVAAAAEECIPRSYASLTPVNPVIVSESEASLDSPINGTAAGGAPATVNIGAGTFLQYVDSTSDPLYSQSNGQIAYPVYTVGDTTMYAASPTYYSTGTTPVTYSQELTNSPVSGPILAPANSFIVHHEVEAEPAPLIGTSRHSPQTDGGVTYMVSGGAVDNGGGGVSTPQLDADAQATIAHATRVSPITVQWLLDNYENAEGVSLPRSALYNHYLYHCALNKLDPVNSASFGKLIRSVFVGLRTRRLGTRGNSKYHYYGIRVKPGSNLNSLNEDGTVSNKHPGSQALKKNHQVQAHHEAAQSQGHQGKGVSSSGSAKGEGFDSGIQLVSEPSPQTIQNQQYLGDMTQAVPTIPEIAVNGALPAGVTRNHIETFRNMYQEHCENILEVIYSLQFSLMEAVWRRFWTTHGNNNNNNNLNTDKGSSNDGSEDDEGEVASKFPSNVLSSLIRYQPIIDMMKKVDYQFYQNIVEVLIPDVLRSTPPALTQSIRNFAKSLEAWMTSALTDYPPEVVQSKVNAVSSLAQTLRRYTSLNHLAQAARAVLQNSSQISQMLSDLNRVDFHNVQEQASWVCQCEVSLVERLEEDFKTTLQQQNSLEQWAEWLQAVVDQILTPKQGNPDFAKHARQFLLKWSFYSSMVIRDLTLRSAASFGSFHLIRLLYDEYMFYLVEHKVASSMDITPIAVMSQYLSRSKVQTSSQGNRGINGDDSSSFSPSIKRPKFEEV